MSGDLISRKAAIEEIYKKKYNLTLDDKADVEEIINNIPTAFDLESVTKNLKALLKQSDERKERAIKTGEHSNFILYLRLSGAIRELLNDIKSAANATNGKIGG